MKNKPMKVLKFGGTSVGSEKGLSQVKKIVESCSEDVIVVVSTLGGITDQLLLTARLAAAGDAKLICPVYGHDRPPQRTRRKRSCCPKTGREFKTGWMNLDELSNIFKGVYLIRDLPENDRHDPQLRRTAFVGDRMRAVAGSVPVRRAGNSSKPNRCSTAMGRFRIHRKIDRTPFRKDASRGDRPPVSSQPTWPTATRRISAEADRTIRQPSSHRR